MAGVPLLVLLAPVRYIAGLYCVLFVSTGVPIQQCCLKHFWQTSRILFLLRSRLPERMAHPAYVGQLEDPSGVAFAQVAMLYPF